MNTVNFRYGGLGRATEVSSANTNVSRKNVASIFSVAELMVSPSSFISTFTRNSPPHDDGTGTSVFCELPSANDQQHDIGNYRPF
jgi:hypothetical protein